MIYGVGTPSFVRVWGEDAQVIPFSETSPDVWVAEDGRVSTLAFSRQAGCSGTALVTLGNGIKLTFGEVGSSSSGCTGALREGRIQRIDRPNGDFLVFTANADGYISSVTDRRGSSVQLSYLRDGAADGHLGILTAVVAPAGTFAFERSPAHDFLTNVKVNGSTLWTLNYYTTGGSTALSSVLDANNAIRNAWTYTDSNRTRVLTEQGPGSDTGNTLTFAYPSTTQTTVAFTAADGTTKTNTFDYASQLSGERSRITDRQNLGDCPGCGGSNAKFRYWAGTTFVRKQEDANGFVTVFQDLDICTDLSEAATCNNATQQANAYDAKGNSKVSYEGCTGGIASTNCTGATRTTQTVLVGTRIRASSTRPSAGGGTVTSSRTFDGASMRVLLDRTQGKTASALDGSLSTTKTRSVKSTYGGGPGGVELTRRDGLFDDDGSGSPPSSAPRTDFAYYTTGDLDACSGTVPSPDNNKNRLKTTTRWVDGTRTLVTKYCNYDGSGRARTVRNAEGTDTTFTFDWRGNVLTTAIDPSGLNLQTCFTYDASANLREIRSPRSTANGRTGFKYEYDSAGRVQFVRQGHFSNTSCPTSPGSGFTKLQSMHYVTDAWGNRITTEFLDATDTVIVSESSKHDAFNRLVELARPANSSTNRTLFSYDSEGNLLQTSDHQGDDVKYVDKDNPTSGTYDRFGRVSQIEQEICAHPSGSENGGCTDTTPARAQYTYDPAGQLQEVRIKEPRVAGNDIVTSYVTDDFGRVVKVTSPDATAPSFYRYDGAGRLLEAKDPRGKVFHYRYDRLGRLVAKINMTAGGDPNSVVCNGDTESRCEIIYCYDDRDAACGFFDFTGPTNADRLSAVNDKGGKLEFTYDKAGRLTEERRLMLSSAEFRVMYFYDANGNVIEMRYPWSGASGPVLKVLKTFDEANRETTVSFNGPGGGAGTTQFASEIEWYPFGGIKSWKPACCGFKMELIQETGSGRLTEIRMAKAEVTREQILYTYASDGNVTSQSSAHDSLSRLSANNSRAFGYDDAGNRTSGPAGSYAFASATNNRLTTGAGTTYGFDAAGNVTSRGSAVLTVADDGTVTAIQTGSGTTTYTRDHRNLRLDKAGAGGSGTYFYDQSGNMIQWTGQTTPCGGCVPSGCGGQNTMTPYETYVYVGGRRLGYLATRRCSSGNAFIDGPRWFFSDKMDMPRALYKTQDDKIWSASLDAFADPISEATDPDGDGKAERVPFRLPGQFALTTQEGGPAVGSPGGLHENWNRVYDSTVGRYLEVDPLAQVGAARVQPYAYAMSSPLSLTDPTGLIPGVDNNVAGYDPCMGCDPCKERDAINDRIVNVAQKIWNYETYGTARSPAQQRSDSVTGHQGGGVWCITAGDTTLCSDDLLNQPRCIQCCGLKHEAKHREQGQSWQTYVPGAGWLIERNAYQVELDCLQSL